MQCSCEKLSSAQLGLIGRKESFVDVTLQRIIFDTVLMHHCASIHALSFQFGCSLTCHPDDLYYFDDVRDGEIVHKQSRLLKPCSSTTIIGDHVYVCLLYILQTRPCGERRG